MPPRPNLLQRATRAIPARWRRRARRWYERRALALVARRSVEASRLRPASEVDPAAWMASPELAAAWRSIAPRLDEPPIPERRGALPPGDRRALFQLVRGHDPERVLEIGTHLGASTLAIAAALAAGERNDAIGPRLTTVDVVDVNDAAGRRWTRHGSELSPRERVERLGVAGIVEFVAARSLDYLAATDRRFDFVFLDGDHAAPTVYREIAAALGVLRPGGVVLLHDYFEPGATYGPDGSEIPGPHLAVERLRAEGARLAVVPVGPLPWPTARPGHATSLVLLLGAAPRS